MSSHLPMERSKWSPPGRQRARRSLPIAAAAGLLVGLATAQSEAPRFSFGVVADVQYADRDDAGARQYRSSLARLRACVADLRTRDLAFTIQLGDLVDGGPDSFDVVLAAWRELPGETRHVIGNHDFPRPRGEVLALLGLERAFYDFAPVEGWRVVVLDGMDLGLEGYPDADHKRAAARAMLARLTADGAPNAQPWNGGVGPDQLQWFRERLRAADAAREHVIVCCHFPVLEAASTTAHLLWNHAEVRELLAAHPCVFAWFNGHDHAGGHAECLGVTHVTVAGMVEAAEENSYAVVDVFDDRLEVRGVGRQQSFEIPARRGGRPPTAPTPAARPRPTAASSR